jgi:hypothetical protein
MKTIISILVFLVTLSVSAQEKKSQIVEVSCGQCKFGMKSKGCDLAVRVDGKSYFTKGTKIDDHGDAHAKDGFCNAIKKAEVVGEIKDNYFVVSTIKILP